MCVTNTANTHRLLLFVAANLTTVENCQNVADILFKTQLTLCKFHNVAGLFYILISFKLRVFKSVTTFREPDKCREYLGLELSSSALIPASIYSCYVG